MKRVKARIHEWAWGDVGNSTVCGQRAALRFRFVNLADITVCDLGDVDVADRCKNCERMRAAIGASSRPKEPAA